MVKFRYVQMATKDELASKHALIVSVACTVLARNPTEHLWDELESCCLQQDTQCSHPVGSNCALVSFPYGTIFLQNACKPFVEAISRKIMVF